MSVVVLAQNSAVTALDWTTDGTLLAVAFTNGHIELWDYTQANPVLVKTFQVNDGRPISAIAWHPTNNTELAISAVDVEIAILNVETEQLTVVPISFLESITNFGTYDIIWNPAGTWVAFSIQIGLLPFQGHEIWIWDVSDRNNLHEVYRLEGHSASIHSLDWHPTQNWLASGSADSTAIVWNIDNGQPLVILEGHDSPIIVVEWNHSGEFLITGAQKVYEDFEPLDHTTLKIWSLANGWIPQSLPNTATVLDFSVNPIDHTLAVVFIPVPTTGDSIRIIDLTNGEILTTIANTPRVETVAWHPNGVELAFGDRTGTFTVIQTGIITCSHTVP